MLRGIHHVGISTASLQRLARFYCDVLGFEPEFEIAWEAGTALGDICDDIIGLRRSTARAMKLRLGNMRVELFEYRSPAGGMRSVYGRDPEGHVIELLEYLPG